MNQKIKAILLTFLLATSVAMVTGCGAEETPYQTNDAENYTVSVKYDANGGIFTTNTSVIVDSYNISEMKTNGSGQVELALLSPDNEVRGTDAFRAVNNGYFLAGWYTERIESSDSAGNKVYSYSGKWDFQKDLLKVDAGKTYSSAEPVVTLYAAWIPLFQIEFYSLDSGEHLDTYTYDPLAETEIKVPAWDEGTGAINMYRFPERSGYTFNGAYYDADGTKAVDTETVAHPGVIDYETGSVKDNVLKLYVDWTEGEWYHIYNTQQFLDNASVNGNYVIHADLDFTDANWPTSLMHGNFNGSIEGNGHTFKNISITQTNNSKVNAGLFGHVTEKAKITDLIFENVTVTIKAGTRVAGTSYGLFAGSISGEAVLKDVSIVNGTLQIDSGCYFGTDDYSIGLLCGMGDASVIDYSDITCVAVGDKPERVQITVNDNTVTVQIVNE